MDAEQMIDLAVEGNEDAMTALVTSIQDRVWAFSVKMLYHRQDAEDATQEILIKIITRLSSFRRESTFHTWAMKIAANHLLNRKRQLQLKRITFKSAEEMIIREAPDPSNLPGAGADEDLAVHEMRVLCVLGLYQCLDRNHRLVYILARAMDITGPEGAKILDITPEAFTRKIRTLLNSRAV